MNALVDDESRTSHAGLACRGEDAGHQSICYRGQIRVLEHNLGRFPAKFKSDTVDIP